jgi:UDP-GlcNAc3NAcA epimerase
MSDRFFTGLGIPEPDYHLGIGSAPHGAQTGAMLAGIEEVMTEWHPDAVLVYGDTNSTLAGALAAAKMNVRVIHLEAGLRSFNRRMPEEINRIATDHLADLLLCPTATAMQNVRREGLGEKSLLTGDVMLDLVLRYSTKQAGNHVEARVHVGTRGYALVTLHRAENTDDPARLGEFVTLLERLPIPALLPVHPRLRGRLTAEQMARITALPHVYLLDPCEYVEMLALERDAQMILTDSGGVQKEAYFLGVPCLTLRLETEWEETLAGGWNRVMGTDPDKLLPAIESLARGNGAMPMGLPDLSQFGSGKAGKNSVEAILKFLGGSSR